MDKLIKALAYNNMVRIYACDTTELVEHTRIINDCYPTSIAALGRTMTGTLLAASLYEQDQSLSVVIDGKGVAGKVTANANAMGYVNGYIENPHVYIKKSNGHLDVGKAVGQDGFLYVTKNLKMKQPFTSQSPLVSGEIAEDFTYYYATSEQVPTSIDLAVLVKDKVIKAGGFILQLLPHTSEEVIDKIEGLIKNMEPLYQQLANGKSLKDIIAYLSDQNYKIIGSLDCQFFCSCSREHYYEILGTLPKEELEKLLEDPKTKITCNTCKKTYEYSNEEIKTLIKQKKK